MFEDDNYDDFQDEIRERAMEAKAHIRQKAREEFIKGCYTAYGILERDGAKALQQGDMSSICRAINRMMSLFLVQEEYERCSFLKHYVEENIPGHKIEPDQTVVQQLQEV